MSVPLEKKGNTRVYRDSDGIDVYFHGTRIVRIRPDKIFLQTGGWRTVTTKRRMNQTFERFGINAYIYQENFEWFCVFENETFKFEDFLTITR
jgi:hypothetical protein